jgi:hypothetical protein
LTFFLELILLVVKLLGIFFQTSDLGQSLFLGLHFIDKLRLLLVDLLTEQRLFSIQIRELGLICGNLF